MRRVQQTRHALGSDAFFTIVVSDNQEVEDVFYDLWAETQVFEATFSRFLPDSELTHVNQNAGTGVQVSREFLELTIMAKKMSLATGGLYTPFILPALQLAGYKGSWPTPEKFAVQTDYSERQIATFSELEIGDDYVKIPASSALDFGGIGKGYLLDQLKNLLKREGISNYWLSLGGDILCAGHDIDERNWQIGIQHAMSEDLVGHIENSTGEPLAIATSGTTKRNGLKGNKAWHHIIDPRTGTSSETDILTATVCTSSAVKADIYAKCAILLGSEAAKKFLHIHHVTPTLLQIRADGDTINVYKNGNILP